MYSRFFQLFGFNRLSTGHLLRNGFVLLVVVLVLLALSPTAHAVTPPPDGGYPNNNTAEGDNALLKLTTGDNNTAIGFDALRSNTSGIFNTATGSGALRNNTGGNYNTANGFLALFYNTGTYNTATVAYALYGCIGESCSISTGFANTATGVYALTSNTTGNQNTTTGFHALSSNATADNNTATGVEALLFNRTGNNNTATGVDALRNNEVGRNNTATGFNALSSNATGSFNTANGVNALFSCNTGNNNTATGFGALLNTTGSFNTAEGFRALANSTGSNNTALGSNAGINLRTGDHNVYIGAPGLLVESETIRIGHRGVHKTAYIQGINGATVPSGVAVFIAGNGQLGTVQSSARFKNEIKPMDKASEGILALQPVTFRYKEELDPEGIPQFGLVAEEVEKVNPDLIVRDEDGKVSAVRYEAVNAMLLNEFLKERGKVQELEKQVAALTAGLQKVTAELETRNRASDVAISRK